MSIACRGCKHFSPGYDNRIVFELLPTRRGETLTTMIVSFAATKRFILLLDQREYEMTDADDVTVTTGKGSGSKGPSQQLVRLTINRASTADIDDFPAHASLIMQAMLMEFKGVKIFPNKNGKPFVSPSHLTRVPGPSENAFGLGNEKDKFQYYSDLSRVMRD